MRITERQLRSIIREEIIRSMRQESLNEGFWDDLKGKFGGKKAAGERTPVRRGLDSAQALKGNIEQLQYAINKGDLKSILTQAQALAESLLSDQGNLKAKLGKKYVDQVEKGLMGPLKNLLGRIKEHMTKVPQDIQEQIAKVESALPNLQRMLSSEGQPASGRKSQ